MAAAVKRERQERSSRGGGRRGGVSAARVGSPQHPSRWTAAEPPANDASIVLLDLADDGAAYAEGGVAARRLAQAQSGRSMVRSLLPVLMVRCVVANEIDLPLVTDARRSMCSTSKSNAWVRCREREWCVALLHAGATS